MDAIYADTTFDCNMHVCCVVLHENISPRSLLLSAIRNNVFSIPVHTHGQSQDDCLWTVSCLWRMCTFINIRKSRYFCHIKRGAKMVEKASVKQKYGSSKILSFLWGSNRIRETSERVVQWRQPEFNMLFFKNPLRPKSSKHCEEDLVKSYSGAGVEA